MPKSRSVPATKEGLEKVLQRMAELEKPRTPDKKGWTQEDLVDRSGASLSTVKRFLKGKPIDRKFVIWIIGALGLKPEDVVAPKEWNPAEQTSGAINWCEVCGKVLAQQREKQNFRQSITGRHLGHEAKNVYVKLGLVKPKEQPSRGNEFQPSADRGMLQYQLTEKEIEQEYQYDEFLEQVIEGKEKNITIVGEPGAGKSTWLEQIALYVDNSNKGFPICISLASLGGKTLEEYLFQIWLKNALLISQCDVGIASAQKKLEELFKSGKVWLLLDGVDEMRADESPLQAIATQLEGRGDLARVVLTCRLNVWEANSNALLNFETYRTRHFDDEQVGDFIQQWFTQEGKPELGEQLEIKLDETRNDRIRDLIKNPLRLAMLCGIWYFHQGDLPKTKATLYQQYIEYFYRWKQHPQLTDDWDKQEELHAAFSKLALEAIDKKLPLRKKFVHKKMGKSLFQLARDVGWLNWVYKDAETGEDVYAFFHLTFQEYFAACAIDDWHYFLNHVPDNPMQGTYRIFEPQWKEVILLWLGCQEEDLTEQKEEFIQALVEFDDKCWYFVKGFYENKAYFLATAGIAEFKDCSFANDIIEQIIKWGYGHFDPEKREWGQYFEPIAKAARAALKETDRNMSIAALIQLIQTAQNEDTRVQAAVSLGIIDSGNQNAINLLVDFIQKDKNEMSCSIRAYALHKIYPNNKISTTILIHIILNTTDEETLQEASEKLSLICPGNEVIIATLIHEIQNTQDEYMCTKLALSLGKINPGNKTAITTLVNIVGNSKNVEMCCRSIHYLSLVGATGNEIAITTLIQLILRNQDEFICSLAARSLAHIDPANRATAITYLTQVIQNTPSELYRTLVAGNLLLIESNNEKAIATLVQSIQSNRDGYILSHAVNILGYADRGNETAVNGLLHLIQINQNLKIQRQAVISLGQIIQGNQFPKIVGFLKFYMTKQISEEYFELHKDCYSVL